MIAMEYASNAFRKAALRFWNYLSEDLRSLPIVKAVAAASGAGSGTGFLFMISAFNFIL